MEKILKQTGFKKRWIYEVVITTTDGEKPNAAPMGIFTEDFSEIKLEVYKDSRTCRNILTTREMGVNFVKDLGVFYQAVSQKGYNEYRDAQMINAPLMATPCWLELGVRGQEDLGDKISFTSEVIHSRLEGVELINRAEALALESLIKITKLAHLKLSRRDSLKKELQENYRAVKKVAPNSKYEDIIKSIIREID